MIDSALRRQIAGIARELTSLGRRVRAVERTAQGRFRSITDGATTYYDEFGQPRVVVGPQDDGTFTHVDLNGPIPPTPTQPILVPGPGTLEIVWDGKSIDNAAWPADFSHIEVHVNSSYSDPVQDSYSESYEDVYSGSATQTAPYTPVDATQVTSFHSFKGGAITLIREPGVTQYVMFVAVSSSGVESLPSLVQSGAAAAATSDGVAPNVGTVLTFISGIGSVLFRWSEISNPDPVTYRLHVRAGSAPTTDGTYEVASGVGLTAAVVRKLKDGAVIVSDDTTVYYGVVTVEDADGPGPSSNVVSGAPAQITTSDIAATAITADLLVANNAIVDALEGRKVTGATLETRADVASTPTDSGHRGVKLGVVDGVEGLFVFDSGGVPFLKAVPDEGMAVIAGEVKAVTATVTGGASLGGVTEITRGPVTLENPSGSPGILRLTAFTTAPKSAPIVTSGYDTIQYPNDFNWIYRYGWAKDGAYWYTANTITGYVERYGTAGGYGESIMTHPSYDTAQLKGIAVGGGSVFVLSYDATQSTATRWAVDEFSIATNAHLSRAYWTHADGTRDPAMWWDSASGELLIAQSRPTNGDKVRIRRYFKVDTSLVASTTWVDCNFAYAFNLAGVSFGPHDLGGDRYIFTNAGGGAFRVVNTSGVELTTDTWTPGASGKVGFFYTGGVFVSMDDSGIMRTYTGIGKYVNDGDITLVQWVANTLANATYETDRSPRAKITVPKRSKIFVTTSAINGGGTNSPDRVRIYIGNNATDPAPNGMARYPDPAVGVTSTSYSALVGSTGTNGPPTINGFQTAGGTVQRLETADGSLVVDGVGAGWALAQSGGFTASAGQLTAATWVPFTVTFPHTFTTIPTVTASYAPGATPAASVEVRVAAGSVTTTGFTLYIWRNTAVGTAVSWHAIPTTA